MTYLASKPSDNVGRMDGELQILPITDEDIKATASLHHREFDEEFLSKFGERFLRSYHRIWKGSPYAISLCVKDKKGILVGFLLGAFDSTYHYRYFKQPSHLLKLGIRIVSHSLVSPAFLVDLVRTRAKWYLGVLLKEIKGLFYKKNRLETQSSNISDLKEGEITHLIVKNSYRGKGLGEGLVVKAIEIAKLKGCAKISLVTPKESGAIKFYEKRGFSQAKELSSKANEEFIKFELELLN